VSGTRVLVLLLALLLGGAGGVTTALVAADDEGGPAPYADPLGLEIPYVDLDCTGEPVLVVALGDNAGALRSAIANSSAREELRYLDTKKSCTARWVAERSIAEPRWVAYLGPGNSQELCTRRMTAEHRGDNVTFLKERSKHRAECLCEMGLEVAPVLSPGMVADAATVIWIRELQDMFATIDEDRGRTEPPALTESDVTGVYDRRTIARVEAYQRLQDAPVDGRMTTFLWKQLADSGCGINVYR
jgi:hypothetical protein